MAVARNATPSRNEIRILVTVFSSPGSVLLGIAGVMLSL
jgi:hypothetical protein